jgi:hypothetical protein
LNAPEHGSDLHLALDTGVLEAPWCGQPHTLWGSGRDAMRALLAWGREHHGWRRALVPSFFCQDVVVAIARELPLVAYDDAPGQPAPAAVEADERDVVFVVNLHGARTSNPMETRAVVVEDHTHDPVSPWAFASDADWAVASLRKTLPLPDGGVLWSPRRRPSPPAAAVTSAHAAAAADRLAAMILKRLYLDGGTIVKDDFRRLAVAGEHAIALGDISGICDFSAARLASLPSRAWREARLRNHAAFVAALGELDGVAMLPGAFAATLVFERAEDRERVRAALVEQRIYPAVLWSLETPAVSGIPVEHVELSRRVLSLHCDFRYTPDDLRRVAQAVRRVTERP